jgi:hypothetical protein
MNVCSFLTCFVSADRQNGHDIKEHRKESQDA